ncbi:HAD family hydrolase [Pseudochrobactrum lubricantis]|uniref:HAD family hydrolase n=1 Tax=Pseudochrobactrum lubricantis TaxID=558172 RepID=UPI0035D53C90
MSIRYKAVSLTASRPNSGIGGPIVLVDADNTLWVTDGVFARAQLALLSAVEDATGTSSPDENRLGYVRGFDQAIAEQHHLGLRYPPRLLVNAIALALRGLSRSEAIRRAWYDGSQSGLLVDVVSQIERTFLNMITVQPDILHGVLIGLRDLVSMDATTLVLTEGNRKRVLLTIEHHGLSKYIDRVFEAPKTVRLFKRLKNLTRSNQSIYMIGDQLRRDIEPAHLAGLQTVYIPGKFRPSWETDTTISTDLCAGAFDIAIAHIRDLEQRIRKLQLKADGNQ